MTTLRYRTKYRKEIAAKERERYRNNTEKIKERVRKYRITHKEKVNKLCMEYYYKNHEENKKKHRARDMAKDHKKEIMKNRCENCGTSENLECHHPDYDQKLKVITLCRNCHRAVHRKYPEEYNLLKEDLWK